MPMFERVRQELANGRGGAVDGIIPGEPAFFRSLLRLESVEWNTVPDSVLTAATMFLREGCPSWLAVSAERANRLQLARTAAPSAATTKTASARTRPTARQRLPAPTAPPAEVLPPSSPEVDMHDGSQAQSPPRSEEDDDSTVDEDEDQLAQDEANRTTTPIVRKAAQITGTAPPIAGDATQTARSPPHATRFPLDLNRTAIRTLAPRRNRIAQHWSTAGARCRRSPRTARTASTFAATSRIPSSASPRSCTAVVGTGSVARTPRGGPRTTMRWSTSRRMKSRNTSIDLRRTW